jgi:SPOR domain
MVAAMKQGNASNALIDLDDLDRQLRSAASAPRRPGADDPLAELARIVGQEDPFGDTTARKSLSGRQPPSFDDFLKIPPRPASGTMPSHTPPVEPLFPEYTLSPRRSELGRDEAIVATDIPAAPTPPELPAVEPVLELGLRPALPDEPELPVIALSPVIDEHAGMAGLSDLEARLASAVRDDSVVSASQEPVSYQPIMLPDAPGEAELTPTARAGNGEFDDMLAEFEAAMRDAGAEKLPAPLSLEPQMVPPPPPELPVIRNEPSGLGMAAAGAAVVAAGAAASAAIAKPMAPRPRRGLLIAGGVIGVALIGIGSLLAFGGGPKLGTSKDAPVIAAKPGVTKERPANPGGVDVPNQDKEVLQPSTATARQTERVAPREEQPVDLTQAQRTTQTEANAPVRQIPGVSIVAPITTTPPAPGSASAPAQPNARPVASVPITIAGQPPAAAAPVAPAPTLAAPAAPSSPTAVAPVAQPSTPAEPRRVRTVPIRPEDTAPARAQAQPRVVPANPRPAPLATAPEPDDANAPLRITPQANRAPQRVASAPERGTVPASTPAASNAQIAQTASTSAGSGFTVQLAAEGSEDAARSKFNRVRGQHSSVLGSLSPNIRSAEVNGRSVYRVRVGSMSREEAVSLCERLKSDGGSCFVARN